MKFLFPLLVLLILPFFQTFAQDNTSEEYNRKKETQIKAVAENPNGSLQKGTKIENARELTAAERAEHQQLKDNQVLEAPILQKYLGVNSANDPTYPTKRAELEKNAPETYAKMKEEILALRNGNQNGETEAEILQKYLGISSVQDPSYPAKREQLEKESPETYAKMKGEIKALRANKVEARPVPNAQNIKSLPQNR